MDSSTQPSSDRLDPGGMLGEREMLRAWLDFQRSTFLWKLDGLSARQMCEKAAEPSDLSLLGLLRHHTAGEYEMFRSCILQEEPKPLFSEPTGEFDVNEEIEIGAAIDSWHRACDDSRAVEASTESLDICCDSIWGDEGGASLRWIMMHAIEEYARHNGHADLLRQRIDGATGY